jgi:hypothetical protein
MKTLLKTLIINLYIGVPLTRCDDVETLADIKFNSQYSDD